jgi:hypothetical protein
MLIYAENAANSWVITSFIYHDSARAGKRCWAPGRVTFSAGYGIQTVMNAGLILMLMLGAMAFAHPDAATGAILGYIAILFARRL